MMCKAQEENKRIWQEEGFLNGVIRCYENGLSIEMIAKYFNVTPETVKEWIAGAAKKS